VRKEADVVAEFRNLVSFYLMLWNVKHAVDGKGTENVPLSQTIKKVGKNRPALEFHCNASGSTQVSGVETLSAPGDMELCKKLCKAIADVFEITNRGPKPEDAGQHHRLAFVKAGGIIVELFFISSPKDLAAYDAKKWLAAKAVATVLKENM
jgi:N-acetylmuramoyl-L-alanine amidase